MEQLKSVTAGFNRSLRIESRTDRLTGDSGAVVLREILEGSGIVPWLTARISDPRSQVDVTHDFASLLRTTVLLSAQGWRDHDDADALRHDPAFRLAALLGFKFQVQHPRPSGHRMLRWTNDTTTSTARNVA